MDIRTIILKRLKALDWTAGDLAMRGGLSCHSRSVYRYLRGDRLINDVLAGEILDRLGFKLVLKRTAPRRPGAAPALGRPTGSKDRRPRKRGSGFYPRKGKA